MTTKIDIETICETPIEINDIKTKLGKVPDTELVLDILEDLEKVQNKFDAQSKITKEMNERANSLQSVNNRLMIRATALNSVPSPNSNVSYTGIDPLQSIIDKV